MTGLNLFQEKKMTGLLLFQTGLDFWGFKISHFPLCRPIKFGPPFRANVWDGSRLARLEIFGIEVEGNYRYGMHVAVFCYVCLPTTGPEKNLSNYQL